MGNDYRFAIAGNEDALMYIQSLIHWATCIDTDNDDDEQALSALQDALDEVYNRYHDVDQRRIGWTDAQKADVSKEI